MYCSKCGNEIKDGEQFCSKCGTPIGKEKKPKATTKTISQKAIIAIIVCVVIVIALVCVIQKNGNNDKKDNKNFIKTSANIATKASNVSFYNIDSDDEKLNDTQRAIVNYFDNDYLWANVNDLQKYPQIFDNAKIATAGGVVKVLKSTGDEFEVLMYYDEFGYNFKLENGITLSNSSNSLFILRGKQLNQRLVENDYINILGRYVDIETKEIDGISYTVPVINAINVNYDEEDIYSLDTIRTVVEHVFGKNVKITKPTSTDEKLPVGVTSSGNSPKYYLATLDNQSNVNFKAFDISTEVGQITYNRELNNLNEYVTKKLLISADFEHFIVNTYDFNLKYIYIDYFDKDLNKLWSREFEYSYNNVNEAMAMGGGSEYLMNIANPMDYTEKQMAVVIDNDLYLIDTKTGKDIINPVIVGAKTKAIMMEDGVILIGTENKDLIMKVDFKGNILYRIDGDSEFTKIINVNTQIANGKLVVYVNGMNENASIDDPDDMYLQKYMVISNDGTVEYFTKDMSAYNG